jgi:hypothetical protein
MAAAPVGQTLGAIMTTVKYILIFLASFILSCSRTNKQTEKETSLYKKGIFYYFHEQNCFDFVERCDLDILKLVNYDTLIYVSSSEYFGSYEEFRGKLTRINDSIYYVKCYKYLRQEGMKPYKWPTVDTIGFMCDSSLIGKSINLVYENKITRQFKVYSEQNEIPIDKNLFNSENNKLKIQLDYAHPIIDENVDIFVKYNSDVYFQTDEKYFNDFYIIIDSSRVKSLNIVSHSEYTFGPKFDLKRHPIEWLNKGRKVRGQKNGT